MRVGRQRQGVSDTFRGQLYTSIYGNQLFREIGKSQQQHQLQDYAIDCYSNYLSSPEPTK